jgi:hypothetical protein
MARRIVVALMSSGRHQCHNDANTQMESHRRRLLIG